MRESTLQRIITVIPVLIILVSVILPFSAHGWDVMGTVLPVNPFLSAGSNLLPGIGGGGEAARQGSMISIQRSGLSEDGSRVFLDVMLRNPMPMQVDVKDFSASIPAGSAVVNLALVQPVSIPSGGSVICRLEGPRPQGLPSRISPLPSNPELSNLKMTISSGGIEIALDQDAIRGMLS
jgi:hypothetical protein